jgi:hypothetical protein
MIEIILFIVSFTVVFYWTVEAVSSLFGATISVPVPILHLVDWEFTNTYISTPAIMYQVYFWGMYTGIFTKV